ncbi:MAG TPA: hypothetical protein VKB53_02900, partial [Gammaproteobacteria bacterium]|nr:hypothetical protein [Gammaproteobacteria bacterium]
MKRPSCIMIMIEAGAPVDEMIECLQPLLEADDIIIISAAINVYPTVAKITRLTVNTYYADQLFSSRTRQLVAVINKLIQLRCIAVGTAQDSRRGGALEFVRAATDLSPGLSKDVSTTDKPASRSRALFPGIL